MRKLEELQKIEDQKQHKLSEIKEDIKKRKGNILHDWEYVSEHHGWTFWYECRLCGKMSVQDRALSDANKKEECAFYNKMFIPNIKDLERIM